MAEVEGTVPSSWYLEVKAERDRLREALEEVAGWGSEAAARHGNRGVREYARHILDAGPGDSDEG